MEVMFAGHRDRMGRWETSSLPVAACELQVWVLRSGPELHGLRVALHAALAANPVVGGGYLGDLSERMVLVATELATNAIKYGRPPTVVRLLSADDRFVLDVADHDVQSVPELADTRPFTAGGRGLMLAQAFCLQVGWYTTEFTKHVWASFPIRP